MKEPQLNDFLLSEEKFNLVEKFNEKIKKREESFESFWLLFFYIVIFCFFYFFIDESSLGLRIFEALFWAAIFLILGPVQISNWLGEKCGKYFVKFYKYYDKYCEILKNKKEYDDQVERYKKYIEKKQEEEARKIEKLKEEEARKIINDYLWLLPELKEKIFRKKITDENYDYFNSFAKVVDLLGNYRRYLEYDERSSYNEFEKYLSDRRMNLIFRENARGFERKDKDIERKSVKKDLSDNIGINTNKITVDEQEDQHHEETEQKELSRTFQGKKVNFEALNKEKTLLGVEGEEAILKYEKEILIKNGREDLSQKVTHISEEEGAGTGYDILSFDLKGTPKYIEVKTTTSGKGTSFMLSENEMAFIDHEPENCYIYRLYNFDRENGSGSLMIVKGSEEIKSKFNLKVSQYKVKLK